MKRLLIVRHAKAEKTAPRGEDFERPLAPRGEADAIEMGQRLSRGRKHLDAIVTSPAERALATAKLIARELDFPWNEIRPVKAAYLADERTLLELVRELDAGVETALIVGHNPGVSELTQALVRDFNQDLPTGAVVEIDLPADTWAGVRRGGGSLRSYDYPKNNP
ncbi:MAG: SixA phosphatase family protein [Candidatus Methylomirabilia bacterium]